MIILGKLTAFGRWNPAESLVKSFLISRHLSLYFVVVFILSAQTLSIRRSQN